ncbi:MAG: PEP-CTERM system TPR-repeat protein PrsT [Alphaproteobacteria bacterium]|nr:PEP-CTERM system TPR-repeat protein PrsT [Alphaproteobacteria bacterium]
MKKPLSRIPSFLAIFLAFALVTSGLSQSLAKTGGTKSFEFYEDALRLFASKDYRGAIIQLKNALQQDHRNLSARVLLGKSYLRLGNGAGAERQLIFAKSTGADESLTLIPLGRALLLQGKNKQVLDEVRLANRPPKIKTEVLFLRGQAHLALRQQRRAERSFRDALGINKNHANAIVGLARLFSELGQHKKAESFVVRAEKLAPRDADVWYTKGEIRRVQRRFTSAIQSYDKAINLAIRHIPARRSRAASLIDIRRYDDALQDVLYLRTELPDDPQNNYLHAVILTKQGKHKAAAEALSKASQAMDDRDPDFVIGHPPSLLLKGVINYTRKLFDDAYPYLTRYVDLRPYHPGARKMVGAILLRRNEHAAAVRMLEPAARMAPSDVEIVAMLGNAYMRNKQYSKATEIFQTAVERAPDVRSLQTRLGLSQLAVGNRVNAMANLESAVRLGKSIGQPDIVLGMVRLKEGNLPTTLALVDRLTEKEPNNPFPLNLAGAAYVNSGNAEKARKMFLAAIKLKEDYLPAYYNLATMEFELRNTQRAKELFLKVIKIRPSETKALFALSRLAEDAGNTSKAIDWLNQVRKRNVRSIPARIKLIKLYLRARRVADAFIIARELEDRYPRNQAVLETKARVQIAAGKTADAIKTFRQASYSSGGTPNEMLKISSFQIRLKDFKGAKDTLKAAITLNPSYLPAHRALIDIEARLGGIKNALEMAQVILAAYPKSAMGNLLTGNLLRRSGRIDEAVKTYELGAQKQPENDTIARRLYHARVEAKNKRNALKELELWNVRYPGNPRVERVLAAAYLSTGNYKRAKVALETYVKKYPKDIGMLNNLALLYDQIKDPRALETAEKAYKLAPTLPPVLDTYGWLLVKRGEASKGLPFLRDASARAAKAYGVRYHIAFALNQLGRDQQAKRELEKILETKDSFSGRAEAQRLWQKLNK